jgi:hypothetical protein
MRVDGQHLAQVLATGSAQLAQGDLQPLSLSHGMSVKEFMKGFIGHYEGQAIG